MTPSPFRKVYQGIADRRQMFRMFDRHAQRPNRFNDDAAPLYTGEWFEISQAEHDYMLNILPPLWMRYDGFALREFLVGFVTSVFYTLTIDDAVRHFHAYCDLSDPLSPDRMKSAIIERESRPVPAMTRAERLEHVWSSTHEEYRGYAGEGFAHIVRGWRTVMFFGPERSRDFRLLDGLSDAEIAAKLPVHLRYLPDAIAA